MPIDSSCVGAAWTALDVTCDTRWVMSYAAGIGVDDPHHLDTAREGGVVACAVFPVAPEWALITAPGHRMPSAMTPDEIGRGIHAGHDLLVHRPVRGGDVVTLSPVVAGVDQVPAGARVTIDIVATDAEGGAVWTTRMTNIHLGVEVTGGDRPATPFVAEPVERRDVESPTAVVPVPIAATAAHVYTECARIWNPIHTDPVVARAAGLPDIVLHGTATLAHGVQAVIDTLGVAPTAVRRLGGSFRAPVPMPCGIAVEMAAAEPLASGERLVRFQVRVGETAWAPLAIRHGFVVVTTP